MPYCIKCSQLCSRVNTLCRSCYQIVRPRQTREERLLYMKGWHKKVKDEVFEAYGGYKCSCCGETNPIFLVIDHINGGGNRERREIRTNGGAGQYWELRKKEFPKGFQVLCHNCNYAKSQGGCPHKSCKV